MVEVPSLLWQLEEIADAADFLSVGSNDLMQYLFAADRDNKRVAERFDPLSAGFLRALKAIADVGARRGTPVALCGEIGGRPLEAMALIALGYRRSVDVGDGDRAIKAMVLSLEPARRPREIEAMLADGGDRRACASRSQALAERLCRAAVAGAARLQFARIPFHFEPQNDCQRQSRSDPCAATRNSARA